MNLYEDGFGHALLFGIGAITAIIVTSLIPIKFSESIISIATLIIATISLGFSFYFWRRSFRPIVTAMVKTCEAGNRATIFNLEISNTGSIPAKNISLKANMDNFDAVLGEAADEGNQKKWLSCFDHENKILILHNNSVTKCSFGYCEANNKGFWKYGKTIPITIEYESWFGKRYSQKQDIQIIDSESFTGSQWKSSK